MTTTDFIDRVGVLEGLSGVPDKTVVHKRIVSPTPKRASSIRGQRVQSGSSRGPWLAMVLGAGMVVTAIILVRFESGVENILIRLESGVGALYSQLAEVVQANLLVFEIGVDVAAVLAVTLVLLRVRRNIKRQNIRGVRRHG